MLSYLKNVALKTFYRFCDSLTKYFKNFVFFVNLYDIPKHEAFVFTIQNVSYYYYYQFHVYVKVISFVATIVAVWSNNKILF